MHGNRAMALTFIEDEEKETEESEESLGERLILLINGVNFDELPTAE